ncbi:MAG: sulfotransferase, partial [Bdellovibrionales bacterium]|nr:sulfotransferase [Bdellovibrionales bacterium]
MNRVFILTGMHRSGTSLLARFFENSGVRMGAEYLAIDERWKDTNPFGYFEDLAFVEFHKELLARCNDTRDDVMWVKHLPTFTEADRKRAAELVAVASGSGAAQAWGWKDPRTCFFLDLWAEILPDARFIFPYRDPDAVTDSLLKRHYLKRTSFRANREIYELWLLHNELILRFVERERSRCTVFSLERALNDIPTFVERFSEATGYPFSDAVL